MPTPQARGQRGAIYLLLAAGLLLYGVHAERVDSRQTQFVHEQCLLRQANVIATNQLRRELADAESEPRVKSIYGSSVLSVPDCDQ